MKRYAHFLASVKAGKNPDVIATVECSAVATVTAGDRVGETEQLFAWCMRVATLSGSEVRRERVYRGTTAHEWYTAILESIGLSKILWVFMHSGSRTLSLLSLWQRLEEGTVTLSGSDNGREVRGSGESVRRATGYAVIEDPPTTILCSIPGRAGVVKIIDVRNYAISSEHLSEGHGEYSIRDDPAQSGDALGAQDWCYLRAGRMQRIICRMIGTLTANGLGSLHNTAGSQAAHLFRHKYLSHSVYVHNHSETLKLERMALHGGRCECYIIGKVKEPVVQLDYSSMYPSCCICASLPVRFILWHSPCTLGELYDASKRHDVVASVTVKTDEPCYPCSRDGLVIFPTGTFETQLCGLELRHALERYRVQKCSALATYESSPILSDMMCDLHALRLQADKAGDNALASWIKSVLVAGVGKFAQRAKGWRDRANSVADMPYSSWWSRNKEGILTRWRSIAWHVQEEIDDGEHHESVLSVPAFVYSAARMKLWTALSTAGLNNCYYCDTDSVWCNLAGLKRITESGLIGSGEIGKLREIGRYANVEFYGWKHYIADGKLTCAGLPKGEASHILGTDKYWYRKWLGAALTEQHAPLAERVQRSAERKGEYKHGRIKEDGRVTPHVIG